MWLIAPGLRLEASTFLFKRFVGIARIRALANTRLMGGMKNSNRLQKHPIIILTYFSYSGQPALNGQPHLFSCFANKITGAFQIVVP